MEKLLDKYWSLFLIILGINFILQLYCFLEVYSRNSPCILFHRLMIAVCFFCTALSFGGLLIIRRSQDEKNYISRKIRQFFEEDIGTFVFLYICIIFLIYGLFYSFMNFGFVFFGNYLQVMEVILFVNVAVVIISAFTFIWLFLFFCKWIFCRILKIHS